MERRTQPLFRLDEDGNYKPIRQRRKEDSLIGNGKSIDFKLGLTIVTLIAGLSSPFVAVQIATAVGSEKMRQHEKTNEAQWAAINLASDLAKRHDAVLPIMQSDISEIKGDIKSILKAVKS